MGASQPHDFFDPTNEENSRKRLEVALAALEDMIGWFKEEEEKTRLETERAAQAAVAAAKRAGKVHPASDFDSIRPGGTGFVAVYDATNSTVDRRNRLVEACRANRVQVMFIESICDDMDIILSNIREVVIRNGIFAELTLSGQIIFSGLRWRRSRESRP